MERIIVGRVCAGRSLSDIDLRGSIGVQVIEWIREEATLAVNPTAAL